MKYGYRWTSGFGMVILVLFLSLIYFWAVPAQAQWRVQGNGDNGWSVDGYWNYIAVDGNGNSGAWFYAYTWMRWPGTNNGINRTISFAAGYDDSGYLNINGSNVVAYNCCAYGFGSYTAKPGDIVKIEYWAYNGGGSAWRFYVWWDPQGDGTYEILDNNSVMAVDPTQGGGSSSWYSSSESYSDLVQKNADRARLAALATGNRVSINQSGSSPTVDIIQEGPINVLQGRFGAADAQLIGDLNTLRIRQGDGSGRNLIELDVNGQSNTVTLLQGWNGVWPNVSKDGLESGGHFIDLRVIGNTNTIHFNQTNAGGVNSGHYNRTEVIGNTNTVNVNQAYGANAYHTFYANISGNSNYINISQAAAGAQFMDVLVSGSGHTINATQTGSGNHKATINLINAGGSSSLNLLQQGNLNQVYNISQACANLSGCSVTVTQGSP